MKIKCRKEEFDLNEEDAIMYNGACYQIITQKTGHGWNWSYPIIAKNKAKQLIKEGKLIFDPIERKSNNGFKIKIYKIKEEVV